MERFVEALEASGVMPELNYNLDAYIITFDEDFNQYAAKVLKKLRDHNFVAEMDYDTKSMKSKMKKALKLDPKYLVFIGEDEINHNLLTVKDTLTQDQNTIQLDEFLQLLGGK